ncbi:hypothetical protein BpHYR1_030567 [Brachionus plicatilis]|uniref:Uncharacterized protein n=1 Tax=Brachionus plicatilis TaxID=10195 RepID=A0A3M7SRB1_BRAPC|nr:hypothetical protein BpHYR1_030567 [Brachionus plicatilis]
MHFSKKIFTVYDFNRNFHIISILFNYNFQIKFKLTDMIWCIVNFKTKKSVELIKNILNIRSLFNAFLEEARALEKKS